MEIKTLLLSTVALFCITGSMQLLGENPMVNNISRPGALKPVYAGVSNMSANKFEEDVPLRKEAPPSNQKHALLSSSTKLDGPEYN